MAEQSIQKGVLFSFSLVFSFRQIIEKKQPKVDENKTRKSSQVPCLIVNILQLSENNSMVVRIYIISQNCPLICLQKAKDRRKKNDSIHGTLDLNLESFDFGSLTSFFFGEDMYCIGEGK